MSFYCHTQSVVPSTINITRECVSIFSCLTPDLQPATLGLKPNSDFPPGEDNARWHLRITILHSSLGQQLGLGIKLRVKNLSYLTLKPQPQCMWAFSVTTEKSNVLLTQLFGIWTFFCLFWNLLASSLYPDTLVFHDDKTYYESFFLSLFWVLSDHFFFF